MLIETLRRETRADHEAIEAAVDIASHLRSVEAYRALLCRFYGFHRAFEVARDRCAPVLDPALKPAHSRAGRLGADLRAVGLAETQIEALPVASLSFPDKAELLGAIYVVEGSSMGGVLIARMAADRLGVSAERGAAFFAGDGRDTARRWRDTMAALDRAAVPDGIAASVRSARALFAAMGEWLAPARTHPMAAE